MLTMTTATKERMLRICRGSAHGSVEESLGVSLIFSLRLFISLLSSLFSLSLFLSSLFLFSFSVWRGFGEVSPFSVFSLLSFSFFLGVVVREGFYGVRGRVEEMIDYLSLLFPLFLLFWLAQKKKGKRKRKRKEKKKSTAYKILLFLSPFPPFFILSPFHPLFFVLFCFVLFYISSSLFSSFLCCVPCLVLETRVALNSDVSFYIGSQDA